MSSALHPQAHLHTRNERCDIAHTQMHAPASVDFNSAPSDLSASASALALVPTVPANSSARASLSISGARSLSAAIVCLCELSLAQFHAYTIRCRTILAVLRTTASMLVSFSTPPGACSLHDDITIDDTHDGDDTLKMPLRVCLGFFAATLLKSQSALLALL